MRIDKTLYDAQLLIVAHSRKGIWAADLKLGGKPSRWSAGSLPTTATAHSLLAVAIVAALRPLPHRALMELSDYADRRGFRPRLEIVVNDPTFVEALEAAKKQDATGKPFKAGKNFLVSLAQQLARWEITLATNPESKHLFALGNWASRVVIDPTIDAVFTPAVVSEYRS
jgi:hypothetical protein